MSLVLECPHCGFKTNRNHAGETWCAHCLHRADVPRESCTCLMCEKLPAVLDVPEDRGGDLPDDGEHLAELPAVLDVPGLGAFMPIFDPATDEFPKGAPFMFDYGFAEPLTVKHEVTPDAVILMVESQTYGKLWLRICINPKAVGEWFREIATAEDRDDASAEFQ